MEENKEDKLQEAAKLRQKRKEEKDAKEEEPFVELTSAKLLALLEELIDLVELHPTNNLNLCLMGGMSETLCLIFSHQDDSVRKAACRVFGSVVQNNPDVQGFAAKSGAINLAA